jgi:Ca2+/Na+ antiporter
MVAAPLVPVAVGTLALATLVLGSRLTDERLLALSRHYDVPEALVGLFVLSIGLAFPGYVQYRDGQLDRRVGLVFFGAYFVYIVGRLVLFPGQ